MSRLPALAAALALSGCPATPAPPPERPQAPLPPPAPAAEPAPAPVPEPAPVACGLEGLDACPDGEVCLRGPEAQCGEGDRPGECAPQPTRCTRDWRPVCGCDGRTYGNPCTAAAAGTSTRHDGPCPSPR